jgi:NAD(P)-dependent dehydrogenase (short-subunit alcohol dehydrogenase family)
VRASSSLGEARRQEAVAEEIRASGGHAHFLSADLSSRSEVEALVRATVERFGSLSILVNCVVATYEDCEDVGADRDGPIGDVTDFAWNRTFS